MIIYMNWDGFAKYYFDLAISRSTIPVIASLLDRCVNFDNAWCGIPAITNPMQTAIASGAYSQKTGNVKLYYDRESRKVIVQRRENRAENILQAFSRQGVSVASVHHFTFEGEGSYAGDPSRPYIFNAGSNYEQRYTELYHLFSSAPVHTGGTLIQLDFIPEFTAFYLDDLDTIGHNNGKLAPPAKSETERVENVLWRLSQLDNALGCFLQQMEELPFYRDITFILMTDHGMTPFTFNDQAKAAYLDLLDTITKSGFLYEVLSAGQSPKAETDLVLCSAGLSLLLTFCNNPDTTKLLKLKNDLKTKTYMGAVADAEDLVRAGSFPFCDLYLSPAPPFIFKDQAPPIGATHDSLDESARHVFAMMWGNGIRKGVTISEKVFTIDFAPTMAQLLNVSPPLDSTGRILFSALE